MQKHLSVLKRARQNKIRKARNTQVKKLIKTAIKNAHEKIGTGNEDEAKKAVIKAISAIDKAASKGVIHKNNSSRKISRLSRKADSLKKEKQ